MYSIAKQIHGCEYAYGSWSKCSRAVNETSPYGYQMRIGRLVFSGRLPNVTMPCQNPYSQVRSCRLDPKLYPPSCEYETASWSICMEGKQISIQRLRTSLISRGRSHGKVSQRCRLFRRIERSCT